MDAAVVDFQTHCVAPLAADACPVMAAEMAGLTRVAPPKGAEKGVIAWRTPGGGTLVIDAYATSVCRVILDDATPASSRAIDAPDPGASHSVLSATQGLRPVVVSQERHDQSTIWIARHAE